MPALSLTDLCMKACIKNAANLRDIGNFEYWKIRPVLLRVTNPEQLHIIEQACPQILGEDAELWKAFLARDIPSTKMVKDLKPDDPSQWWELYSEYLEKEQKAIDRDTVRLREALMGLQKVKEKNVSKVVEAKYLPRLPKDGRMFANNGGVPISLRRGHGFASKKPSALNWTGSKIKTTDSSSVLTQARREAKMLSSRTRPITPSQQLPVKRPRVGKAPMAMLEDYRRAAIPERKIYPAVETRPDSKQMQLFEEREKRLRALTATSRTPKPVVSTVEDSPDDDLEDLFSEKSSPSVSPPLKAARSLPESKGPQARRSKDASPTSATVTPPRQKSPPLRVAISQAAVRARKRKPEVDIFNKSGTATKKRRVN